MYARESWVDNNCSRVDAWTHQSTVLHVCHSTRNDVTHLEILADTPLTPHLTSPPSPEATCSSSNILMLYANRFQLVVAR